MMDLNHPHNQKCAWYFVASSGATTVHMKNTQSKDYYKKIDISFPALQDEVILPGQFEILDKLAEKTIDVDYVTITIGGNDLGFADIVKKAAIQPTTAKKSKTASTVIKYGTYGLLDPNKVYKGISDAMKEFSGEDEGDETSIKNKIKKVYEGIREKCGEKTVIIVVGYPTLLDESGKGFAFSKGEADCINQAACWLDEQLEELVNKCGDKNTIYASLMETEKRDDR